MGDLPTQAGLGAADKHMGLARWLGVFGIANTAAVTVVVEAEHCRAPAVEVFPSAVKILQLAVDCKEAVKVLDADYWVEKPLKDLPVFERSALLHIASGLAMCTETLGDMTVD